ncbi:hypothetical protein [Streptomyces sp. RKAG293]|uniref:hypothetical protein n=1 Tax=Streptomyces sp. RKAG293 TaxID=2893403 RepID=UPI002034028B|nr:hypothetical protein [Streptomyces sp. RKAG293]MCM2416545.1 hypothetical protein [Streptomyces sp. RKAG293]
MILTESTIRQVEQVTSRESLAKLDHVLVAVSMNSDIGIQVQGANRAVREYTDSFRNVRVIYYIVTSHTIVVSYIEV